MYIINIWLILLIIGPLCLTEMQTLEFWPVCLPYIQSICLHIEQSNRLKRKKKNFFAYWAGVSALYAKFCILGRFACPIYKIFFLHIGQGNGLKRKNIFCILGRCACPICKILHIGPGLPAQYAKFCVLGFFAYWAATLNILIFMLQMR